MLLPNITFDMTHVIARVDGLVCLFNSLINTRDKDGLDVISYNSAFKVFKDNKSCATKGKISHTKSTHLYP